MDRRDFLKRCVAVGVGGSVLSNRALKVDIGSKRPNVLFIAIDDMNDWTGFLGGHPQAKTPNMDRLAEKGLNFRNAHCSAPGCSPSRNALLFGVEPFNSGLYPFYTTKDIDPDVLAKYTTLPQLFMQNGYNTFGAGKIHHGSSGFPAEWTDYHVKNGATLVYNPDAGYQQGTSRKMAFCPTTNPFEDHPDHQVASYGVDILSRDHDKPFFLAVGIVKPHLAFVCPQQFFDMHSGPIEPPSIKADDLVDISWPGRGNARLNDDLKFRGDEAWEKVRRAYLACISWADYNVGRVLDALEASDYADNTIIVLWSDHGYHLGEKRSFRKFSLWEEACRVPFIIRDTRQRAPKGRASDEAVSLIDIYRTLTTLAGVECPDYVDGVDLSAWLDDPGRKREKPAMTSWGRGNYTVRTRNWRYTRYFDGSEELYDHRNDGQEWTNLAASPEYDGQKQALAKWLPEKEAPLELQGKALHSVVDADQPDLAGTKALWDKVNATIEPPLD